MIKKISAILISAVLLSSYVIIIGTVSGGEDVAANDEIMEYGLGGLWNPNGPTESETCHIVSPESLFRDNINPLPNAVDNSAGLPPVGNQRWQGSCTAWAIGYYHATYIENKENAFDLTDARNQASPAFLYNIANGGYDGGSYPQDVANVLINHGTCSMAEKPYDANDYTSWPGEDWIWVSGMKRKATRQNWINTSELGAIDDIRAHIAAGNTATIGINVWGNFDDISSFNNTYSSSEMFGTNRGGHQVTICGYDDEMGTADGNGAFRMVNSWGTGWGDAGYWWMTYEATQDYNITHGWVLYLESQLNYTPKIVAKAQINHGFRGDIVRNSGLSIRIQQSGTTLMSKSFLSCYWIEWWYGSEVQQHPFPNGKMAFDISSFITAMDPSVEHAFHILMANSDSSVGQLLAFEVLNPSWWEGGVWYDAPMLIQANATTMADTWIFPGFFGHSPIQIDSDVDMAHQAIGEFWQGDGTTENPYIISGYYIWWNGFFNGIYIGNTTSHFIIEDCYIEGANTDWSDDYTIGAGLYLNNANSAVMRRNNVTICVFGIVIANSKASVVEDNVMVENTYGNYDFYSTDTIFRRNNVTYSSEIGTAIDGSINCSLYHNNYISNTINAWDATGQNNWDDGYPSGGNYWSNYSGTDIRSGPGQDQPFGDGIGDTPYEFEWNADQYPLMQPWDSPPGPARFGTELTIGWNLISIPLAMANTTVENVLSSISGNWDSVKYYDSQDSSDPWKSFRPSGSSNDLVSIEKTMGIWIHATGNCTLIVEGELPATTNVLLYAGWNLVGYPAVNERSVGDCLWGTGADRVEVFDPASPYLISEVVPEFILRPGMGLWVRVPADTVWVIDW